MWIRRCCVDIYGQGVTAEIWNNGPTEREHMKKERTTGERPALLAMKNHEVVLEKTDRGSENDGVCNPACIRVGDQVHVFYRTVHTGNYSTVGHALLNGPLEEARSSSGLPDFIVSAAAEFAAGNIGSTAHASLAEGKQDTTVKVGTNV